MDLTTLIKAGVITIQLITYESKRVHGLVNIASQELGRVWYLWNRIEGLKKWDNEEKTFEKIDNFDLSSDILDWFNDEAMNCILILEDFHPDFDDPRIIQRLKIICQSDVEDKSLILLQPISKLPCELEKDVHVETLDLPDIKDMRVIYESVCKKYGITPDENNTELLEAALGLTIMEAERAFSLAAVVAGKLTSEEVRIIISEKENIIKKSGHLEYYHPDETMDDIGGLENLKDWLTKRGRGFSKYAKEYGLDTPKGVLMLGIPGTGKSLAAKAVGNAWNFPLLKLDMGKVFGGIVGESERNIRDALKIAEAISPSILWVDEIEKGMSGLSSSGSTDGGTTSRVLGTFLTWMQEKKKPVFVVATANNISQLPPELLRKGRMDEIFFVDLPGLKARKEIFSIHLRKKKRNIGDFDIDLLRKTSKGFSGAEIEEALKEAMFQAYDRGEEVTTADIKDSLEKTFPLSKTMHEVIGNMREWAKSRAVFASSEPAENFSDSETIKVPKLKQETYNNPFI